MPKEKSKESVHATSAEPPQSSKQSNLTLADWMTVFAYVDENPTIPQAEVVDHFSKCATGALIFTQLTLSHKLDS